MKYALIGCGRISHNHIKAAKDNRLEIVALCDLDRQKAEAKAQKEGISGTVKIYTDYRNMLKEVKPELVAVATYSGTHAQIALDCIAAGCNVIIEKPIAMSLSDADAIIEAAERCGVTVSACHQNRFNLAVQKTREKLEAGSFGRLLNGAVCVRWFRDEKYYKSADWRGTWAQDGGALMNQCIHGIDLLRWMLGGEIDEVFAYTANLCHPYIEAEDLGLALIRFKNGTYATVEGTVNSFPDNNYEETLTLFGTDATVKLGGKSVNRIDDWLFRSMPDSADEIKAEFSEASGDVYGHGHSLLYADVIDAVAAGHPPYVTAADGKAALELVLAIYKSAAVGKPVKLPLGDCSTVDFI